MTTAKPIAETIKVTDKFLIFFLHSRAVSYTPQTYGRPPNKQPGDKAKIPSRIRVGNRLQPNAGAGFDPACSPGGVRRILAANSPSDRGCHGEKTEDPGAARQKPPLATVVRQSDNPGMTALYLERYLNYGLTGPELRHRQADRRHRPDRLGPVAMQPPPPGPGQARPRRHPRRRRRGLRISLPPDPGDRQASDRGARPNLAYLSLVEVLYGYPLDGVVLLTAATRPRRR